MYQYICSNVCAARYSGVVTFKHSKVRVVSGCTQKPSPGSQVTRVQWSVHFDVCVYKVFQNSDFCLLQIYKSFQFCPDHKDDTGPVVLAEHLSNETRAKLKASRSQKDYAQGCKMQLIRHYIFFLFSVLPFQTTYSSSARWSSTTSKRTSSLWGAAFFGVKMCYLCLIFRWANISDETWEPRNAIPGFVGQQKLFDDDHEFIDPWKMTLIVSKKNSGVVRDGSQ